MCDFESLTPTCCRSTAWFPRKPPQPEAPPQKYQEQDLTSRDSRSRSNPIERRFPCRILLALRPRVSQHPSVQRRLTSALALTTGARRALSSSPLDSDKHSANSSPAHPARA